MSSRRFTLEDLQRKGFNIDGNLAIKENKIRGAQKSEIDGVKFASKLELYMYNLLKATKIPFEFQVTYVIQPGFVYRSQKIQPVKIIVDFKLEQYNVIIDTKGHQLADNKIKFKMLKYWFYNELSEPEIELPSTKEECEALINKLLKLSPG